MILNIIKSSLDKIKRYINYYINMIHNICFDVFAREYYKLMYWFCYIFKGMRKIKMQLMLITLVNTMNGPKQSMQNISKCKYKTYSWCQLIVCQSDCLSVSVHPSVCLLFCFRLCLLVPNCLYVCMNVLYFCLIIFM